jgi:hypothetical protein
MNSNEFVTFQQANLLNALGFEENCITAFTEEGQLLGIFSDMVHIGADFLKDAEDIEYYRKGVMSSALVLAPLRQQALRWVRQNHPEVRMDFGLYQTQPSTGKHHYHLYGKTVEEQKCIASRGGGGSSFVGTHEEVESEYLTLVLTHIKSLRAKKVFVHVKYADEIISKEAYVLRSTGMSCGKPGTSTANPIKVGFVDENARPCHVDGRYI